MTKGKFFMDLDDGDIGFAFDEFGVNSKGDPLMRVGDNMITSSKNTMRRSLFIDVV